MNILLYINDNIIPEKMSYPGVPKKGDMVMIASVLCVIDRIENNTKDSDDDPDLKVFTYDQDKIKYNKNPIQNTPNDIVKSFLEKNNTIIGTMSIAQILTQFYNEHISGVTERPPSSAH